MFRSKHIITHTKQMDCLVAPISGGCFPIQLASIKELCNYGYLPEICFTGSGGCVAVFCSEAGDWNPSRITQVASTLNSKFFIQEWENTQLEFIPRQLMGFFSGAMYNISEKSVNFFRQYFDESNISQTEIWIGATNDTTGKLCVLCNRSEQKAIVKERNTDEKLIATEKYKYLNGDVDKICSAILASSSIQVMIEPVKIDDGYYGDCGVKAGSALTPLRDEIEELTVNKPLHIIYLTGYNLQAELTSTKKDMNILTKSQHSLSMFVRSIVQYDRLNAINLIKNKCEKGEKLKYGEYNINKLGELLKIRKNYKASLLEIHPIKVKPIDMSDFEGEDVIRSMNKTSGNLSVRIWWVED